MTYDDAVEFLDANSVENGIQTAADSGAIIFAIMVNLKTYQNDSSPTDVRSGHKFTSANKAASALLQEDSGVVILSTNRQRNISLLTEADNKYLPLGVVRYISATRHLEPRIRRLYEGDSNLLCLLEQMAIGSLEHDPTLAAIVSECHTSMLKS